jgi:lipopolysaccharide/colanic/teichoic acid biosynthesis glycosyltransferase
MTRPVAALHRRRIEAAGGRGLRVVRGEESHAVLLPREPIVLFRGGYERVKRILDVMLCVMMLPAAVLLMGVCALAIWLDDPGPVVFAQYRTGRGGRRFKMLKFRSMVQNAHDLKAELAHLNEHSGPDFKITDDPRVTRVGRFLRKTSLDELPQIINVLKGEMSLVGPRPTSFAMDTYSLWHTERLEVVPGITGLWQVNGRGDVDFDDRVRLDIEYVETRSLLLDLKILVQTVLAVFRQRGAY